ncbi:MAG TPA: helix-turn-helix domain-containing protein [Streptosporangiaceae bacterium]
MADAYVEAAQGDLAELEAGRRELVDALLRAGSQPGPELTWRAIGLGLDPTHSHVVVLAELVPDAIRRALADPVVRATLHAFVEADLSVAATASAMSLHPNSLRYRLGASPNSLDVIPARSPISWNSSRPPRC